MAVRERSFTATTKRITGSWLALHGKNALPANRIENGNQRLESEFMSWSIGYDERWKRDIGYGVPAYCDHPGCGKEIDRGLAYVCGGEPYGGEHGCGLYFCEKHLWLHRVGIVRPKCERCAKKQEPFPLTPEHPDWIQHKLTDPSWQQWRDENPEAITKLSNSDSATPQISEGEESLWD